MRRAFAPLCLAVLATMAAGCSIMGSQASKHPGITDENPDAVTRVFPATATQMAQIMTDVMSADPILDKVSMTPSGGREFRNFSRSERKVLGMSALEMANDVNYDINAKSKNGHPVIVAVRLKGEASCELSVLYGSRGDEDLSKDLLDKAQAMLASASQNPTLKKAAETKTVED
jgi:hypothetical protein